MVEDHSQLEDRIARWSSAEALAPTCNEGCTKIQPVTWACGERGIGGMLAATATPSGASPIEELRRGIFSPLRPSANADAGTFSPLNYREQDLGNLVNERERDLDLDSADPIKLARARILYKQDIKYERPELTAVQVAKMKARWQGRQLKRVGLAPVVFGFRRSCADFWQEMSKAMFIESRVSMRQSGAQLILAARAGAVSKAASLDSHPGVSHAAGFLLPNSSFGLESVGMSSVEMPIRDPRRESLRKKMGRVVSKIRRFVSSPSLPSNWQQRGMAGGQHRGIAESIGNSMGKSERRTRSQD